MLEQAVPTKPTPHEPVSPSIVLKSTYLALLISQLLGPFDTNYYHLTSSRLQSPKPGTSRLSDPDINPFWEEKIKKKFREEKIRETRLRTHKILGRQGPRKMMSLNTTTAR